MKVRTSALRLRAVCLTLSAIAAVTTTACGGPGTPNHSTDTTTGQAASPAGTSPTGTPSARSTDPSGSADRPGPGSASSTTTGTAADTTAPAQDDGEAREADHSPINTPTIAQVAPEDGGNAHTINTSTPVTFDPNAITDPVDRNDPAKVAAAYLLARLECDSNSISLADCLGRAADLAEPGFGRLLMKKAQNADDWRRQVLDSHLVVTVRIDDIAIQPSGDGYQVSLAYTRSVSGDLVVQRAWPAVTTMAVQPRDTGGWWVTGDTGFGAG